jgi:hypothetical protein
MGRPFSTKRRRRVIAAIQWMRIAKKMHAPMTGVAKRTSSPTTVATNQDYAALSHTATLSRLAKLAPQNGGATKIGPPLKLDNSLRRNYRVSSRPFGSNGIRDRETIDVELRLLAAVRRSIREQGGEPSGRQVDELLDELSLDVTKRQMYGKSF